MFPVHWFSIRLSWEWLCLYSQESSPLTLKSSVHLSSVNGWNLKEPKGPHVFLWMNLWRKNSHVMLNAADPTEKFAPLLFIFPSFQQKKLGCKPQTPWREWHLWHAVWINHWYGVWTETCYPPFEAGHMNILPTSYSFVQNGQAL